MRWPWLFVLVFLAYLLGLTSAKLDPRAAPPLASFCTAPFQRLVGIVYPTTDEAEQLRFAGRVAGAFWTAAAVAMTFEALRMATTSWAVAVGLALLAGFASPLWSWASRSDTIEAPAALLVALLLWLALLPAVDRRATDCASGALAASLWALDPSLGWAVPLAMLLCVRSESWTRRAAIFSAAGVGIAVFGLLGLAAMAGPPLMPRIADFAPAAFAAYLVAPARSLVLFAPVAGLAAAALVRREQPRWLVRGAGVVVLVAILQIGCLKDPWGPQSFGPALLAPLVPLLAAMASGLPSKGLRWGCLVALPMLVAHGAAVFGGSDWDSRRVPVADPDAVWDVRDSPFSDLANGPPPPVPALFQPRAFLMLPGEHATRADDVAPWLAFGWEAPEPTGTWASGHESWIVLAVPPGQYAMTLTAAAPSVEGRAQRLEIERPGGAPIEVAFSAGLWNFQAVTLLFQPEAGITVLRIRPAHTWRPGRGDLRRLSLFVASLRLQRIRG